MDTTKALKKINDGAFDAVFGELYPDVREARKRYSDAVAAFRDYFGDREIRFFSSPGRSEICGNHTDHNNGKAIGASVNLDTIAVVAENGGRIVRVKSEGFCEDTVNLDRLEPILGSSAGIVAGMAAGFAEKGTAVRGFDAYTTSAVPFGSGLSSSAAFENLLGAVINGMFGENRVDSKELARISQFAENTYFGKPCGLLDQMASAVGDMVYMDFGRGEFDKLDYAFDDLDLVIIKTAGSHASLGGEYSAIREEMSAVAALYGKTALRDCDRDEVFSDCSEITRKCGDRAFLRAMHFFNENIRVDEAKRAISERDETAFLDVVRRSGLSSYTLLQNIYCSNEPTVQPLSTALCVCSELLSGTNSAWRIHGGGFAGTVQAFVPRDMSQLFADRANKLLDGGQAYILNIRKTGAREICES